MRPSFPPGPATRSALYWLGLLAALKALALVMIGQAVASVLAGLVARDPDWGDGTALGLAGVVLRSLTVWGQAAARPYTPEALVERIATLHEGLAGT